MPWIFGRSHPASFSPSKARRRAASALTYGLLLGLVTIAALGASTRIGSGGNLLFGQVASRLSGVTPLSAPTGQSLTLSPLIGISLSLDAGARFAGRIDSLSVSGQPGWLSFAPASRQLTGTPPIGAAGTPVTLTLTAGNPAGSATAQITLTPQVARMCRDLFLAGGSSDGSYPIDPDGAGSGAAFNADCVLSDGGWTKIVASGSTPLSDLTRFPVIENTIGGTYTTNGAGISWGSFSTGNLSNDFGWGSFLWRLRLQIPYGAVRMTYSGAHDTPSGGLGRVDIGTGSGQNNILGFSDGNTAAAPGHFLAVGGVEIFNGSTVDVSNRTDTVTLGGPASELFMSFSAYTSTFAYTRRYLRELWVR